MHLRAFQGVVQIPRLYRSIVPNQTHLIQTQQNHDLSLFEISQLLTIMAAAQNSTKSCLADHSGGRIRGPTKSVRFVEDAPAVQIISRDELWTVELTREPPSLKKRQTNKQLARKALLEAAEQEYIEEGKLDKLERKLSQSCNVVAENKGILTTSKRFIQKFAHRLS
jgi:hypothetical protein